MRTARIERAALRLLGVFVVVLALAACEVRAEVTVDVADDGSGSVEVAVGVDDEVLERRPDVLDELALDDLLAAGWTASPPRRDGELTWRRLRHDFEDPAEVGPLLEQVSGDDGPFAGIDVTRRDEFAETSFELDGTIDLRDGAQALVADPELSEALGADTLEVVESAIGAPLDEVLSVSFSVRLPGEVDAATAGAERVGSGGFRWEPSLADGTSLDVGATGTVTRTERWVWAAVAAAATVALVVFLVLQVRSWRRRTRVSGSS